MERGGVPDGEVETTDAHRFTPIGQNDSPQRAQRTQKKKLLLVTSYRFELFPASSFQLLDSSEGAGELGVVLDEGFLGAVFEALPDAGEREGASLEAALDDDGGGVEELFVGAPSAVEGARDHFADVTAHLDDECGVVVGGAGAELGVNEGVELGEGAGGVVEIEAEFLRGVEAELAGFALEVAGRPVAEEVHAPPR